MEVPGFSLRSGSKLRRLSEALREGQFAIGNGRGDEFLRQERETEIRGRRDDHGVLATGGAANRGSRNSLDRGSCEPEEPVDRGRSSFELNSGTGGRTFMMFHGTSWRNWQRIKTEGLRPSGNSSGLGTASLYPPPSMPLIIYPSLAWAPPPMFSDGHGHS